MHGLCPICVSQEGNEALHWRQRGGKPGTWHNLWLRDRHLFTVMLLSMHTGMSFMALAPALSFQDRAIADSFLPMRNILAMPV